MSISNGVLGMLGLGAGAASTVMGAYGAYDQAKAQRQAAEYNATMYDQNAGLMDKRAELAIQSGEHEAAMAREQGIQTIESQRAGFAASGVKVDSGSALDVIAEQAGKNQYDQNMIKYNADVNAWGYKVEAANLRQQASFTRASGQNISPGYAATTSLLNGSTSLFNQYRQHTF